MILGGRRTAAAALLLLSGATSALTASRVRSSPRRGAALLRAGRFRPSLAVRAAAAAAAADVGAAEESPPRSRRRRSGRDAISDWVPPSAAAVRRATTERIGPMKALTSPVFFSTDAATGRRVRGLGRVPTPETEAAAAEAEGKGEGVGRKPRAVLFVSNHQLIGIDSWMVVSELIQQRGLHARSLVHPLVFGLSGGADGEGGGGILSSIVQNRLTTRPTAPGADDDGANDGEFLAAFGGVPVSPRNLYRLMETGQPTLLFPGGARESFRGRDGGYSLDSWPPSDERADFVRVAAKFDATIVPFSSVGAAESAALIVEPPNPGDAPFGLGDAVVDWMGGNAPFDARWDNGGEALSMPLVLPKPVPARHGYLFHAPIRLRDVDHRDRAACRKVYRRVKAEIRGGIVDLLRASQKDPFRDTTRRLVYETVWGKQAPTFLLEELNRR